jgi:glucose-1-phosphate thymidylyltransferase
MKGILLAGGAGSRLHPLTRAVSKQLLPVFNKPMIYYPLSTLMLSGIREILVITTARDQHQFQDLLGNGEHLGLSIEYVIQDEPKGIAHALLLGEKFAAGGNLALILGDNIFYGAGVGLSLKSYPTKSGATVFAQKVTDPSRYGVIQLDSEGKPTALEEKPSNPKSDLAVTGLYFFDNTVFDRARELKPSSRGELEVTDLNLSYLASGDLHVFRLPRGTAWLDSGTVESLAQASEFVKVVESRQGLMIACPEEIAWKYGYLDDQDLIRLASGYGKGDYSNYLRRLVGLQSLL